MNDNLMVSMVTQEIMDSPEAVVIYFASIANQSLAITAIFVSSRNEKERCVTKQNGCMGAHFLPAQLVIVSVYCLVKELRKRCVTKQRTAAPD